MRLISLRLQNFRQHADTKIEFRRGLTGVIGPNGAGKSTILEAIAWAIYGAPAARGTNETIRFARAPGRARVLVELAFELGGHEFRVNRTLSSADLFLDNGITPVATGLGGVSSYLENRIGMTREEFFNTYFTSQKELQFLAQLGPRDRGRFLAQVLGYERLRVAQDHARDRRRALQAEILGIREVLPDPDVLREDREKCETRVQESRKAFTEAERTREQKTAALAELKPRWTGVQQKRERTREIAHEVQAAERDGVAAHREVERAQGEIARIAEAEQQLAPLRTELADLAAVSRECERFAQLRVTAERRRALEDQQRDLDNDLRISAKRLKELESAPELLKQYATDLENAKAQLTAAEQTLAKLREEWAEQRQDVRTKLQQHLDRHDELKSQIAQLRTAGPDGTCPICTRPLGKEFNKVVGLLEEQFEEITQNGKWLRKREAQLEKKPEDLAAAEEALAAQQKTVENFGQRLARCEQAVQEIWTLSNDRQKKEQKLKELRTELERLPGGYDAALHQKADARLKSLREVEQKAARFEQILEGRAAREKEHKEATERARDALAKLEAANVKLVELAFDQKVFDQIQAEHETFVRAQHAAEIAFTEARARHDAAKDQLARARKAEKDAEENRVKLRELQIDLKHHHELDAAFAQLRAELNARVRPELGELASSFLTDITDGRYTALEIDENYNVLVLDEGEEKPVISGGEEDVANLVLRIAISQMIAERAGQQLSVLFLDEVFGSLDLERRDNVVQLLHKLEDRFEQVVLITHIETIREGLDHTIRVTYDERTGASTVAEENLSRVPDLALL